MLKTADFKMIGLVAVGVIAAGYLMNAFRSNEYVNSAISGYDA